VRKRGGRERGRGSRKGKLPPKFHATLDDCSRVAAQVHLETTSAAVRPAEMERPAVEKTSELLPVCSFSAMPLLDM